MIQPESTRVRRQQEESAYLEDASRAQLAVMDAELSARPESVALARDLMGPHRRSQLSWDAMVILEQLGEEDWRDVEQLGNRTLRPFGFSAASIARLREAGWQCIS